MFLQSLFDKKQTMRLILVFFIAVLFHKTTPQTYTAAVVEYYPLISDTPKSTILWNLHQYKEYVRRAKRQRADIIIFPEYGLTSFVNFTKEFAIEIDDYSDVIVYLQGLASGSRIYLVVNLLEKVEVYCCQTAKYYSTNLVFDRNGTIVLKYRKINVFKEDGLVAGDFDQNITFTTDFGVTFATFTSHDILFEIPAKTVSEGEVIDVVYPSAWSSSIPFYSSLSIQHGYSIANRVNLLASGLNQPQNHCSGTGIYLANGKIVDFFYKDKPGTKLLVYEVANYKEADKTCSLSTKPKQRVPFEISYPPPIEFHPFIDKFKDLDLVQGNISTTVCDNDFCCFFNIEINSTQKSDFYKLIAFDGCLFYNQRRVHIRFCGLLLCKNDLIESCGSRTESSTTFSRISVRKNLSDVLYIPVTLNYDLWPLGQILFCDSKNESYSYVEVSTEKIQESVLVFGIFGQTDRGSSTFHVNGVIFLFILLTQF